MEREGSSSWPVGLIVSEIVQSCVGTGASYRSIVSITDHGARPDTHRHRMIVRRSVGRSYRSAAWTRGDRSI